MNNVLTNERLLELQDYLQKNLQAYTDAMDSARKAAGYRAIIAPQDTAQLIIYKTQHDAYNEARVYISMLLTNFPELDSKKQTK